MPPRKRDTLAAAVPTTEAAITYLRDQGQPAMADAVQTTLTFATEAADAATRKAVRDATTMPNQSIQVPKDLYDRVQGTDYAEVARKYLAAFRDGTWMPGKPERAPRGQAKEWLNARFPAELWDEANALAKDPVASEERGYKLTARQIVIAALLKEFPAPEEKPTAKKAASRR
jgi:hypothetical protein